MTSRTIRALFATLLVAGLVATVPSVASAGTTYATISDVCWQKIYPPDPCHFESGMAVGMDNYAVDNHSFFNVSYSLPPGAEVTKATLRLYTSGEDFTNYQPVEVATVANWSFGSTNWWSWGTPGGDFWTWLDGQYTNGVGNWFDLDVTAAIQAWEGSTPNYGLGLFTSDPNHNYPYVAYFSDYELEIDYDL
jgi:hypothetical protein